VSANATEVGFDSMRRGQEFGPFLLLTSLAHGGVSQIHRARVRGVKGAPEVVVKRLRSPYNTDDDFLHMLADEAELMNQLRHRNIAQVYEFGQVGQQYFLATEFVDGVNLRQLFRRLKRLDQLLPIQVAIYVMSEALIGLHYAHTFGHGVVHRDFTPSNLMLGFDGRVKLIDFGIAKSKLTRTKTRGGVIKGKLKYMSPEQTRGRQLSVSSDIFSAGVVVYECLTGQCPFQGDGDAEIISQIRDMPPATVSCQNTGVDHGLDLIVERALDKNAEQRFSSALAFSDALTTWANQNRLTFDPQELSTLLCDVFEGDRRENQAFVDEIDWMDSETNTDEISGYTRLAGTGYTALDATPDTQSESNS